MEALEEFFRQCATKTAEELLPIVPSLIIPRPHIEGFCRLVGHTRNDELLRGIFRVATICDERGKPFFRHEIIEQWVLDIGREMNTVLNSVMCALTYHVYNHLDDFPALKGYIDAAIQDEKAEALLAKNCPGILYPRIGYGSLSKSEAWFFCRDLRFKLGDEAVRYLAGIDQRYECGFTHTADNHILIPWGS